MSIKHLITISTKNFFTSYHLLHTCIYIKKIARTMHDVNIEEEMCEVSNRPLLGNWKLLMTCLLDYQLLIFIK